MRRALIIVLLLAACADGGGGPLPGPASVLVHNRTQYTLQELRIHEAESYADATNTLTGEMEIDEQLVIHRDGPYYVTVLREKNRGGEVLAFTTGRPLSVTRGRGYKLEVFDEMFRLLDHKYIAPVMTSSASN